MAAHAKRIEIAPEDRPVLEKWARSRVTERRLCDRARMVLMAAEGRPAAEIAARVGCSDETAKRWRSRYEREGLDGLRDLPKTGRPLTHDDAKRAKLIGRPDILGIKHDAADGALGKLVVHIDDA